MERTVFCESDRRLSGPMWTGWVAGCGGQAWIMRQGSESSSDGDIGKSGASWPLSLFPNRWTIGPRVLCPKSETESTFLGKLSHLLEWNAGSNTGVTTLQWSPPCLALGEPHTPTHQILSMYPKAKLASHLPGSQTWSSLHQCHPLWEVIPDRPR